MKHLQTIFGDKFAFRESILVAMVMLGVTLLYEGAMMLVIPDFAINGYELLGTWCALNAVWLVRTQNIQNWAWGTVGVLLLGVFFGQIGLPGQQWLQWAFFIPVQVWSWYYWATGGAKALSDELPVTMLSMRERIFWLISMIAGTFIIMRFIEVFAPGSLYPVLDALVVVASMTAQFLMGRKKVESWILWLGPVNTVSIVLFALAGAYVLTALYIAFFVHAFFGVRTWYRVRN